MDMFSGYKKAPDRCVECVKERERAGYTVSTRFMAIEVYAEPFESTSVA
jgi:hypothetical protein